MTATHRVIVERGDGWRRSSDFAEAEALRTVQAAVVLGYTVTCRPLTAEDVPLEAAVVIEPVVWPVPEAKG